MKLYSHAVLIAALAVPAFCQEPSPAPKAQAEARALTDQADRMAARADRVAAQADKMNAFSADRVADLGEQIARMKAQLDSDVFVDVDAKVAAAMDKVSSLPGLDKFDALPDLNLNLDQLKFQFDFAAADKIEAAAAKFADKFDMAFLQSAQAGKPFPPDAPPAPGSPMGPKARIISIGRGDGEYDQGMRALDQHHYEEAATRFDAVINSRSTRADGALYWKAWALNRAGKRDDALAAIAQLRRDFASSGYLNDAQALEAEVKQNAGQPVSPAQESNEDLKLLAINSLMNADADRAIPLIESFLKGSGAPNVKDRALFVLAQSKAPRAQQVLSDYAKGSGNPDLQLHAIQYVGMSRSKDSQQLLAGIYSSSSDARVKNSVLQQLMNSRSYDTLLNISKTEKDASLRDTAIRYIASDRSAPIDGLIELYSSSDVQAKHAIVEGFQSRHEAKTLVDLARKESDPAMKRYIVERLGSMKDSKEAMDYMVELASSK